MKPYHRLKDNISFVDQATFCKKQKELKLDDSPTEDGIVTDMCPESAPPWNHCPVLRGSDNDREQLYVLLGMLVVEGRLPGNSLNVDQAMCVGPHTYGYQQESVHTCITSNSLCKRFSYLSEELRRAGRLQQPVIIEVYLLPTCPLHRFLWTDHNSMVSSCTHNRLPESALLLERWQLDTLNVQQPKSACFRTSNLNALLTSVRSFLHFSQLSAWLVSSHGTATSMELHYRICGLNELTASWPGEHERREFPLMTLTDFGASGSSERLLRFSVIAAPRTGDSFAPQIVCPICAQQEDEPKIRVVDVNNTTMSSTNFSSMNLGGGRQRYTSLTESDPSNRAQMISARSRLFLPLDDPRQDCSLTLNSPLVLYSHHGDALCDTDCGSRTTADGREFSLRAPPMTQIRLVQGSEHLLRSSFHPTVRRPHCQLQQNNQSFGGQRGCGSEVRAPPKDLTPFVQRDPSAAFRSSTTRRSANCHHVGGGIKKKERFILFSDSSSNESLDNLIKQQPSQHEASHSPTTSLESLLDSDFESSFNSCDVIRTTKSNITLATTNTTTTSTKGGNEVDNEVVHVRHLSSHLAYSAGVLFNRRTGLPQSSSPAPLKRHASGRFLATDDNTLDHQRQQLVGAAMHKAIASYSPLALNANGHHDTSKGSRMPRPHSENGTGTCVSRDELEQGVSCSKTSKRQQKNSAVHTPRQLSSSAPSSTSSGTGLVVNFEESLLNGRISPVGVVDGFQLDIGAAGGHFCPNHVRLPVSAFFFQLSEDNAPSPYLGHVSLQSLGRRGYHVPRKGTLQLTLFNPQESVVKMFVVMYDFADMPPHCQTFLRQRTLYMPVQASDALQLQLPCYLRYLIHLRFMTTRSGKLYLHTDIKLIFTRDKFEFDPRVATYELRSFTETPKNPTYSPKK